jgi:hypothetical protein
VVDDLVVYVGLSKSDLHTRFEQYGQGHKRERTSVSINDPIASTLAAAKRVKVLVATPEPSEWNRLAGQHRRRARSRIDRAYWPRLEHHGGGDEGAR